MLSSVSMTTDCFSPIWMATFADPADSTRVKAPTSRGSLFATPDPTTLGPLTLQPPTVSVAWWSPATAPFAAVIVIVTTVDAPAAYVNKLYLHAVGRGATAGELDQAVNEFGGSASADDASARARVLLRVTQAQDFAGEVHRRSFVQMQYIGYLRRNANELPDANFDGYDFWLQKLNQFNGNFIEAEMVKAFIESGEYRARFGP